MSGWSYEKVLTLPSGIAFTIDHIGKDAAFADPKSLARRHAIHSAKEPKDLYPVLPVIRFALPANATGPLADVTIPEGLPPGTVAFYPGLSLLEFFESSSSEDRKVISDWLTEQSTVELLSEQLFWTLNKRQHSDSSEQMLYSAREPRLSAFVRQTYSPEDLAISAASLFPESASEWKPYASDAGFLRLRPSIVTGVSGPQGSIALGNPPSLEEVDAWDASKAAGVWDYWSFLAYIVVPSGEPPNSELVLFFRENTFFDRPREVVARIQMSWSDDSEECEESEELERQWTRVKEALSGRFQTAAVSDQIWTIDGVQFDARTPDE